MASSLVQSCTFVPVLLCFVLITCGANVARLGEPCEDNPAIDCADLNKTAQICTAFPHIEETRTYCPKFCGVCGNAAPASTTAATSAAPASTSAFTAAATSAAPALTSAFTATATAAPYTGACVDDLAFNCADMDQKAKICTVFRDSQETRLFCPKYCGLCGGGSNHAQHSTQSVHGGGGSTAAPVSAPAITSAAFTGACVDDPAFKCADMDKTAKICTVYRDDQQTRKYCPKYCGLCGSSQQAQHSTQSVHGGGVSTAVPAFTGACVDDPTFKCADMDKTAKICTVYRDDQQTREYCPKYCGLCGSSSQQAQHSTQPVNLIGGLVSTAVPAFTGACVDDPTFKCADMDKTAKICTVYRDDQQTREYCPKYCGLCGSSHGPGSQAMITHAAVVSSKLSGVTAQTSFTGACEDDKDMDCADLDKTAHICTTFRDNPETRKMCPKFCGLCNTDTGTTSGTMESTTLAPLGHSTTITGTQTSGPSETTTSKQVVSTSFLPLHITSTAQAHTSTLKHSETTTSVRPAFTTPTSVNTTPKHLTTAPITTSKQLHETTSERMSTSLSSHTNNNLSTVGPSESTTTPSLQTALSLTFHAQDRNKDGVITYLEFEELWKLVDRNGDDRVTLAEYSTSTHFSKYISSEVYQFFDHDHNRVITIQEVPRIFLEFDSNYDGKIEENEYIVEYTRMYNFIRGQL